MVYIVCKTEDCQLIIDEINQTTHYNAQVTIRTTPFSVFSIIYINDKLGSEDKTHLKLKFKEIKFCDWS